MDNNDFLTMYTTGGNYHYVVEDTPKYTYTSNNTKEADTINVNVKVCWEDMTEKDFLNYLKPSKVIFNDRTTIVIFPDGTKVTATCMPEDTFSEEVGVAMCIMKKIFKTRSAFLDVVKSGVKQPTKEEKKNWKTQKRQK